jgi:TonB family protein
MRVSYRALAIICASAVIQTQVQAGPPLQPQGQWRVNYDVAQCVAARDYGTKDKPLDLVLKPSPHGTVMRLFVFQRGGAGEAEQLPVTLWLGAHREFSSLLHYRDDTNGLGIVAINLPMEVITSNLAATNLRIESQVGDNNFQLTEFAPLVTELDKCVTDLRDYWNIGEAYKSRIATPAKPKRPLRDLFSPMDYPRTAIQKNQEGGVTLSFLVDEHGKVADCTVDQTSGIALLDTMSCYVISKRAQFTPALDRDGKPVRSAYSERVVWNISP